MSFPIKTLALDLGSPPINKPAGTPLVYSDVDKLAYYLSISPLAGLKTLKFGIIENKVVVLSPDN